MRFLIGLFWSSYLLDGFKSIISRLFAWMEEKIIFLFSVQSWRYFVKFVWFLIMCVGFNRRFRNIGMMNSRDANILLTFILVLKRFNWLNLRIFVVIGEIWIMLLWLNRKLSLLRLLLLFILTVLFWPNMIDLIIFVIIVTIVKLLWRCLTLWSYCVYIDVWILCVRFSWIMTIMERVWLWWVVIAFFLTITIWTCLNIVKIIISIVWYWIGWFINIKTRVSLAWQIFFSTTILSSQFLRVHQQFLIFRWFNSSSFFNRWSIIFFI